jgi:hypothetical protein
MSEDNKERFIASPRHAAAELLRRKLPHLDDDAISALLDEVPSNKRLTAMIWANAAAEANR